MPIVYRVNTKSRKKVKVFISDALWDRMKKRPNVFKSQFEFEAIPNIISKDEISDKKSTIYSSEDKQAHDDLGDAKEKIPKHDKPEYTEDDYRKDLAVAKLSLKEEQKEDAKFFFERAYNFKKSAYVKGQINKLS